MKRNAMRRSAKLLARHAASIVPIRPARWGEAMEREIEHIEDDVDALRWAIGCVWASYAERAMHLSKPTLILLRVLLASLIGMFALSQLPIVLMVWGYKTGNLELAAATDGAVAGDDFNRFAPLMDQMSWLQIIAGALQFGLFLCAALAILVGWRRAPLVFGAAFLLQVAGWLSMLSLPAFKAAFGAGGLTQNLVLAVGLIIIGAASVWVTMQRPNKPPTA